MGKNKSFRKQIAVTKQKCQKPIIELNWLIDLIADSDVCNFADFGLHNSADILLDKSEDKTKHFDI